MVELSILDTPMPSQTDTSVGLSFRCILSEKVAVICSPGRQRESSHFSWPFSASPPQASGCAPPSSGASSRLGLVQAGRCPCDRNTCSREHTREAEHPFTPGPRQVSGSGPRSRFGPRIRSIERMVSYSGLLQYPRLFTDTTKILMLIDAEIATLQQARDCCLEEIKAICLCAKGQAREKASYERRCPRKNPEAQKKHWAAKQEAAK